MPLLVLAFHLLAAAPPPTFDGFSVRTRLERAPAAPVLATPTQRLFRTQIRRAVLKGPNFAGHYTLAEWGCGSGCVSIAIVDDDTGRTFDGPFSVLTCELATCDEAGDKLSYEIGSRLLIVRGCAEEKNCATSYYEWTGERFRLLLRRPMQLPKHGP